MYVTVCYNEVLYLQENWKAYNWTHITTLMMFADLPSDLMCYAHELGVRVYEFNHFLQTSSNIIK